MSQRCSAPASPPQPRSGDCCLLLGLLPQPLYREVERPCEPRPPWNAEKSGLARTLALPVPAFPGNCTVGTPSAHRSLAVVPPLAIRRYYGEAPMRLRRGDGPMSGKPPQIRIPRRQEASLADEGAPLPLRPVFPGYKCLYGAGRRLAREIRSIPRRTPVQTHGAGCLSGPGHKSGDVS
jgi:hypothetical protein